MGSHAPFYDLLHVCSEMLRSNSNCSFFLYVLCPFLLRFFLTFFFLVAQTQPKHDQADRPTDTVLSSTNP
jgi:hypothetical protein